MNHESGHTEPTAFAALLPSVAAAVACALAIPGCTLVVHLLDEIESRSRIAANEPLDTDSASSRNEPITPVPRPEGLDADKVALGRTLFHEPGLSANGTIACASCHSIDNGGDDGRATSAGVGGAIGSANAPTVLNASLNFRQFWDGRAATLEEQVAGPIHNPIEMASDWNRVLRFLKNSPAYREWFARIYPDGVSTTNVSNVIAEYERSLVTPDSPFDLWLKGDDAALTNLQQHGYQLFKENGCISCHQGVNIGGNIYQPLGVMRDYFDNDDGDLHLGRYNVTGNERDKHVFKVPSLRNVSNTGPYFHDGSAETLEEAIRVMFEHQLGLPLDDQTLDAIKAFLESLTAPPMQEAL